MRNKCICTSEATSTSAGPGLMGARRIADTRMNSVIKFGSDPLVMALGFLSHLGAFNFHRLIWMGRIFLATLPTFTHLYKRELTSGRNMHRGRSIK